jgi:exopolyphosphatase / guanosine-5'-triphosphate,3'-diphosphate pyrophosphatase
VHAVIDIGTNTLLLLVVDAAMQPIVDLCRFGRLGTQLDATKRLDPDAIATSLGICREYREVLDGLGVSSPRIVGTQALREAENRDVFVTAAEQILGGTIEVISGAREAELAFTSVRDSLPELAGTPYIVVDVGGGSTEVVVCDGIRVVAATSLPIGAVRLTERHLRHDPPTAAETRGLFAEIDRALAELELPSRGVLVATAGTATTLAALSQRLARYDARAVTGYRMNAMAVDAQLARLLTATVEQRKALRGMEPERAAVIAGGVAILARLIHRTDATALITADRGVRWGLVYELAAGARSALNRSARGPGGTA